MNQEKLRHVVWHRKGKPTEQKIAAFRYHSQAERFVRSQIRPNEYRIITQINEGQIYEWGCVANDVEQS